MAAESKESDQTMVFAKMLEAGRSNSHRFFKTSTQARVSTKI